MTPMTETTAPAFPVFAAKHADEGMVTPEEMIAHRRRGGRLPAFPDARGAVICLERGLPEQMRRRVRVRHAGRLLGDLYSVRARRDRVLVLANFGLGAPAVAAQAEELIALGARRIVSVALSGGLQADLRAGDIVIADSAIRDEGTSHHYLPWSRDVAASPDLITALSAALQAQGVSARRGSSWSTDAPYRETRAEVMAHQAAGVLTVDMELAALLAVAARREVQAAGVLVVGDSLAGGEWRPPARLDQMRRSLQHAYRAAIEAVDAG
jgi:uridine phosphorylase